MELAAFQHTSGRLFVETMAALGYDPEVLSRANWDAIMAMSANDGSRTNLEAYYARMIEHYGEEITGAFDHFREFYSNEFNQVKEVCGFNPEAGPAVRKLKEQGYKLVLATNAWFPENAILARLDWAGVDSECFDYMTLMENSHYCKPKLEYYREILETLDLKAEECLMVGNDVQEDMIAAETGMQVFLMTDCLINRDGRDISSLPQGSFKELFRFLGCPDE